MAIMARFTIKLSFRSKKNSNEISCIYFFRRYSALFNSFYFFHLFKVLGSSLGKLKPLVFRYQRAPYLFDKPVLLKIAAVCM